MKEIFYHEIIIDIDLIDVVDQPMPEQKADTRMYLLESIKEKGIIEPIVVEPSANGRFIVKDGRTRLDIAKQLRHKRIKGTIAEGEALQGADLGTELEVLRRHLPEREYEKRISKYGQGKQERAEGFLDGLERKLTPEMKEVFKEMRKKGLTSAWKTIFYQMASMPRDEQQTFFNDNVVKDSDREAQEIMAKLRDQIEELEERLDAQREKEKEQGAAINKMREDFDKHKNAAIARIEEDLREENLSESKIAGLIEQAKEEVRVRYEADLKEMNTKLQELSKSNANTAGEIETLKLDIINLEKQKTDFQLLAKRNSEEFQKTKRILEEVSSVPGIIQQLSVAKTNLETVLNNMSRLEPSDFMPVQHDEVAKLMIGISDLVEEIDNFFPKEDQSKKKAKAA